MRSIKNIGRFCKNDHNGFIINDASLDKIDTRFFELIEKVIDTYRHQLGSDLHSVYIRGSIPRGLGIPEVSDLDTLCVTNKALKDLDLDWVNNAEQKLNKDSSCINGVEMSFFNLDDICNTKRFSIIPFMIKTHSVCVYGEDLRNQLPAFKADAALANEHIINLESNFVQAKEDLRGNEDKEDILDCCVWIMKIIIRAGLALVMEKEKQYTRDLYPAYEAFSRYYPEKKEKMLQALEYAINPIENTDELIFYLNDMGKWMIETSEEWLLLHNPHKERNGDLKRND
ncbi:nucleotidyltransferase [Terribacillus saccharophilus]|nr:nucleotidyltransferase [Terribacillus saccharophilus]